MEETVSRYRGQIHIIKAVIDSLYGVVLQLMGWPRVYQLSHAMV
jgi:hypothetical protein